MTGKLDEESRELLRENESEILKRPGAAEAALEITDGQTYEDYLLAMILVMNSNVRILRIMDLIQINMKYRYYDDFNFAEYYTGVRFSIHANQNTYTFQESYR